jgi:hypothetical protein
VSRRYRSWPFVPESDGIRVNLGEDEREVLTNLIVDLRQLLVSDSHEMLRRLKPPAHPDNAEAETAYRELVGDDLLKGRLELLDVVDHGIAQPADDRTLLDEEAVTAWMQALNMMRLVLGERLELDGADLQSHDLPREPATFLFGWTGELLEFLVRAASAEV